MISTGLVLVSTCFKIYFIAQDIMETINTIGSIRNLVSGTGTSAGGLRN